ncbi:MAG: hypothetical protein JZU50_13505, partial [Desulfobulbaceae bacterium]|nr:hypothetical protein [Desulfobulbaceae bacterium]
TPVLNGTLSQAIGATDVVQVFDGADYLGNATVTGTTWSYALGTVTPLAAGSTHSYTARVGDAAGNVGTLSSTFTLTESSPAELLTNATIEGGTATGWGLYTAGSTLHYEYDATNASYHYNFNGGGTIPGGSVFQTLSNLIAGQTYYVQYQLNINGYQGVDNEVLNAHVQNGATWNAGTLLSSQVVTQNSGTVNYSFTFTAASSTATVVFTNTAAPNGASTDLWLNKASVMLISEAAHSTFTPLVLDLNGDGVHTTDAAHGVLFDVGNTGMAGRSAWADSHDGLLVRDINHNGAIDHGGELFGEGTLLANNDQAANGFAALAQHDANQDSNIDGQDAVFKELLVWQDGNSDGVSQADELHSLTDLGITSLNLAATSGNTVDNGNLHGLESSYTTIDGKVHELTDVWFQQGAQGTLTTNAVGMTTLQLVTEGQSLDLTTVDTARLQGVDRIDLTGAGANTLTLSRRDVLEIGDQDSCTADKGWTGLDGAQGRHQLVVDGDGTDQVVIEGGGFVNAGTAECNGVKYEVYNSVTDSAQLLINHQVVMG